MSLHDRIKADLKTAMLAKDSEKVLTLRGVSSMITNEGIAKKLTAPVLPDEIVLPVIQRAAKQRKEAVEAYKAGNRPELAEAEEKELAIIQSYLPQMMSRTDITVVAQKKKEELGINDKSKSGALMAAVMKELKGRADGNDVKAVVDSLFN